MRGRYELGGRSSAELLAALAVLVRREHELLADFLAHLAELDERRHFVELGYPSTFAYCTEALGLSKSAAGRRIAAARLCRKYPDAFARMARGELRLSVLCELAKHVSPQNAAELFELCNGQSYERATERLAGRFPKPDVRDSIRRLPLPMSTRALMNSTPNVGSAAVLEPETATKTAGTTPTSRAEHRLPMPIQRPLEPLSADRYGVHFTADREFRDLLAEVRALASHQYPGGDLLTVMKRGLEAYREQLQKTRFAVGRKPRRTGSARPISAAPTKRTRHVSATVAREVYERDGARCTFVSSEGRRCGAQQFLELDHIAPWAAGGDSSAHNLRLSCHAHNQHAAQSHFGAAYMRAAIAHAKGERQMKSSTQEPTETSGAEPSFASRGAEPSFASRGAEPSFASRGAEPSFETKSL